MPGGSRFLETWLGQWLDLAACRGTVTSATRTSSSRLTWTSLAGTAGQQAAWPPHEQQALAVCDRCPVQVECLAYAITTRQHHGVWGGKTQQELHA